MNFWPIFDIFKGGDTKAFSKENHGTYAMSRNVNFLLEQRLNFVSTAYSGPMEPISIDIQIEVGGRFESL